MCRFFTLKRLLEIDSAATTASVERELGVTGIDSAAIATSVEREIVGTGMIQQQQQHLLREKYKVQEQSR